MLLAKKKKSLGLNPTKKKKDFHGFFPPTNVGHNEIFLWLVKMTV